MKTFVLGGGFVSSHLPYEKITQRICQYNLNYILDNYKPDILINCIGKTGRPNIDWCENNKEETIMANTTLPLLLADFCSKNSIKLIHISSGCIFNPGHCGWKEDDLADPPSFYSRTKYTTDLLLGQLKNVASLRIRMPISTRNDPRNFINKIRNYKQLIDIQNSVTFLDDFVKVVDQVIEKDLSGIYHVTNPQTLSAVDVIKEYQKYFPDHSFEIISIEQLNQLTLAKRSNCVLDTNKLNSKGIFLTNATQALTNCMKEYVNNL